MKQYKYGPEVRAFLAKQKRDYLARKKAKEAKVVEAQASPACKTPLGVVHDGNRKAKQ